MDIAWILLIVLGVVFVATVVIAFIVWYFCNGCRRGRTVTMCSNRPERVYSIYGGGGYDLEKKKTTDDHDPHCLDPNLLSPEPIQTRTRRTVTINDQVDIVEIEARGYEYPDSAPDSETNSRSPSDAKSDEVNIIVQQDVISF